jgi:hypothetical protein
MSPSIMRRNNLTADDVLACAASGEPAHHLGDR